MGLGMECAGVGGRFLDDSGVELECSLFLDDTGVEPECSLFLFRGESTDVGRFLADAGVCGDDGMLLERAIGGELTVGGAQWNCHRSLVQAPDASSAS